MRHEKIMVIITFIIIFEMYSVYNPPKIYCIEQFHPLKGWVCLLAEVTL